MFDILEIKRIFASFLRYPSCWIAFGYDFHHGDTLRGQGSVYQFKCNSNSKENKWDGDQHEDGNKHRIRVKCFKKLSRREDCADDCDKQEEIGPFCNFSIHMQTS